MIDHDQLIKSLIKSFFKEYLELFFPDLARRLCLDSPQFPVEFLDKEHFTDIPKGRRRTVDILARVWTVEEMFETILVHSEHQEDDRQDPDEEVMPFLDRMFCYSLLLQLRRFPEHVVPIVLWFVPGKGGVGIEAYDYKAMGAGLTLTYYRIGVPDLEAEEYLRKNIPLAYGLAARMKRGKLSKVQLSLACQTRIVRAPISDVEKAILLDFVKTYAKLDEKEAAEMQAILDSEPEYADVKQSELTYYGRMEAKIAAEVADKLTTEVTNKVTAEVTAEVTNKVTSEAIITVLEARGIGLSDDARQRVLGCTNPQQLEAWLKRAGVAQSADELLKPIG